MEKVPQLTEKVKKEMTRTQTRTTSFIIGRERMVLLGYRKTCDNSLGRVFKLLLGMHTLAINLMHSVTSVADFEALLTKNKYVFVDFYADWCGPCRMIAPIVEKLSTANEHICFVKINVDDAQELARKYSVSAMPTFMAFTNGSKSAEVVGADKAGIERTIASMK